MSAPRRLELGMAGTPTNEDFARNPMILAGCQGEIIRFNSGNPANFHAAISEPDSVSPQEIVGQLFLPSTNSNAVVIVVPGSLGVAASHITHAERLISNNIGALLIDPFGPRQVTSTVANQAQYSFAASSQDVVAAAARLADDARVDESRIGAQGHSRGGTAVLNAAISWFPGSERLWAVYAAYPWCGMQFLHPVLDGTVVRSIIGDRDEWCLPQQVQGYMQAMQLAGGDVSVMIVPGAQHSFDRDTPVELIEDASVAPSAPTIFIEDNGTYVHPVTGSCDSTTGERELMLYGIEAGYGVRGARIGTTADEASVFVDDMLRFWRNVL